MSHHQDPSPSLTDSPSIAPPELRTARLLLRSPTPDDADAYFELVNSPDVNRFGAGRPLPYASVLQLLERIVAAQGERRLELAIALNGPAIGRVMLIVDTVNRIASVGYGLLPAHWGRGFATEATVAVVDYAFEQLGLDKVWARADARNLASVRVLEKVGMQREGLLRQEVLRRGERVDRVYYGLLRDEWATARERRA